MPPLRYDATLNAASLRLCIFDVTQQDAELHIHEADGSQTLSFSANSTASNSTLEYKLPCTVNEKGVKAKFSRRRKTLVIDMPFRDVTEVRADSDTTHVDLLTLRECSKNHFMMKMIGLNRDSSDLRSLLESNLAHSAPRIRSFPDCEYWNYTDHGMSLCFENVILDAIHIDKRCHLALPFGFDFFGKTGKEVVQELGEPTGKKGGGKTNICVVYGELGLELQFDVPDWENPDCKISALILFSPSPAA